MLGQSNTNTIATYIKIENEDITVTQNGVYEAGEEYTGLGTVTVQVDSAHNQEKSIAPTTSEQIVTPDQGYTGLSSVTVGAVTNTIDNNIQAGNIKSGVNILGITGNVVELNATPTTITPTTSEQTITPQGAYNGFSTITVDPVTSSIDSNITSSNIVNGVTILGVQGSAEALNGETITISPTTSQQIITPTSPHNGITEVTVDGVTSSIDNNIVAENIKSGVTILGVNGTVTELNGTTLNVTPTASSQSHTPSAPNNAYTQVIVDGDVNLVAGNIVKDVTIFGVTGNYEGQVINNQDLVINENGIYRAESGYTGLGEVTVNVSSTPTLKNETFTQNGVYTASNSYVALKWWGDSKQAYTGSSTLVGDWIWFNSNNFFSPQVGDHVYNGKDVDGEIVPDFEDAISTIVYKEISSTFYVDFIPTIWELYAYDPPIEINDEKYFKVNVEYPKQDSSKPIVGNYVWVRSDSLEEIDEGTLIYNSTDSSDLTPDLTYTLGTVTSTDNMNASYTFADVNSYTFRYYRWAETNRYSDGDYDGYGTVTVNVPSDVNNQNISVTVDGIYTADQGYSGLGTVNVTAGAVISAQIEAQLHEINSGSIEEESGEEPQL